MTGAPFARKMPDPPPLRTRRIAVVLLIVPTVVWTFVSTLARGVKYALRDAWWDARSDVDSAREIWRGEW